MALIKCIECGTEISDKSDKCIKCGCPTEVSIPKDEKNMCSINGTMYDLTPYIKKLLSENASLADVAESNKQICKITGLQTALELVATIKRTHKVPPTFTSSISRCSSSSTPKCPTCNSTDIQKITGTERAVSVLGLGILSKKINKTYKCKHCGYTW